MAKTVKYEMYFSSLNTSGPVISISKKEFERQLKFYKDEIAQNHKSHQSETDKCDAEGRDYSNIEGYMDDMDVEMEETEKYTSTRYMICDDGAWIILKKKEAKPGYHWK